MLDHTYCYFSKSCCDAGITCIDTSISSNIQNKRKSFLWIYPVLEMVENYNYFKLLKDSYTELENIIKSFKS